MSPFSLFVSLRVHAVSTLQTDRRVTRYRDMRSVHTEALAGHGEKCRCMSAIAGASGDRVLVSTTENC